MTDRSPRFSPEGRSYEMRRFEDLPLLYQSLGKACLEVGVLDDFYELVEGDLDFGDALQTIRIRLSDATDVNALFKRHGISDNGFDDL